MNVEICDVKCEWLWNPNTSIWMFSACQPKFISPDGASSLAQVTHRRLRCPTNKSVRDGPNEPCSPHTDTRGSTGGNEIVTLSTYSQECLMFFRIIFCKITHRKCIWYCQNNVWLLLLYSNALLISRCISYISVSVITKICAKYCMLHIKDGYHINAMV